jgi:hypothetical protein
MGDLTIVTLCQALSNITNNRCSLVENSHTCRCVDDIINPSRRIYMDFLIRKIYCILLFFFRTNGSC